MANCIAWCWGEDKTRLKEAHRIGSVSAQTKAATWRTFVLGEVRADGRVHVQVIRDGVTVHTYELGEEDKQ